MDDLIAVGRAIVRVTFSAGVDPARDLSEVAVSRFAGEAGGAIDILP